MQPSSFQGGFPAVLTQMKDVKATRFPSHAACGAGPFAESLVTAVMPGDGGHKKGRNSSSDPGVYVRTEMPSAGCFGSTSLY